MGDNPIEKTITLKTESGRNGDYLELNRDGTALYFDSDWNETMYKFKYTYDADAKKIYMQVEKTLYFGDGDYIYPETTSLMTYNEIISQINKDYTVGNLKKAYDDWGKEDFDSYTDFEKDVLEGFGVDSFEAYAELIKDYYKAIFSPQVTYSYKTENGKMTLTEKFTGVKNMLNSSCAYSSNGTWCSIWSDTASFAEYNDGKWVYYYGTPDTGKIAFRNEDDGSIVPATYTENISAETVTIKFKDKEYVCEFDGTKFTQE